jgi:rhomboid protease GluP
VLCALNVAVFLAMVVRGVSFASPSAEQVLQWGAEYGPLVFAGQWWRLFTAMFLHFGILHLALNMWCLWQLGFLAEFLFGRVRFLVLYILSGLGGAALSLLVHPTVVSAGASGAIFGLAGGVAAFLWLRRRDFHSTTLTRVLPSVATFIGYNLLFGFSQSGIDNAGHVGGLIVGAVLGALVPRPKLETNSFARLQFPLAAAAMAALIAYGVARARH